MVDRNFYLQKLIRFMWNGEIKVITGLRRCGKSVLLFDLFCDYLRAQGVDDTRIIKIALDQRRYYKLRDPIALCEYVEAIVQADPKTEYYLLLDEVQMTTKVTDRENGNIEVTVYDMLNELKAYKNLDVYVTGSNSKGLSSDIATQFRGRASQIRVYPFSFEEYYGAVGGDARTALDRYILFGGMPRLLSLQEEQDKKEYLINLYRELYLRDIVERNGVEREELLEQILDFLASQTGSLTNPTKIANTLSTVRNESVNNAIISRYLQYIEEAFLVKTAKRYDIKGKTYFSYPNKYYYTDLGLRNAKLNYRQYDPGHLMENLIFNELIRRGYSVDVGVVRDRTSGQNAQKEIDFVVNDTDRKLYIQSAFMMSSEEKADAELNSLLLTNDFFKKTVIRMDIPHSFYDENGIFHCSLLDFLLNRTDLFS